MTAIRFLLISLLLLMASCGSKKKDKPERINLIENKKLSLHDTAFSAYYSDTYYSPYIVRLDKNKKSAFILVDSAYDKVNHLDKNTREAYYQKALSMQPASEIEAYRAIWAIPEMRELQTADGSSQTIVTIMKEKPEVGKDYYIIEVKRNDVEQLSTVHDIAEFRIRMHPRVIDIADESGYFVPLEVWRKARKK